MGKIKLACKSCGKEVEREEKPAPKNKVEAKQILFNCSCGATNLRDGSAYYAAKKKTAKPAKEPAITGKEPAPGPIEPEKPAKEPAKPAEEPERSNTDEESSDDSPLVI